MAGPQIQLLLSILMLNQGTPASAADCSHFPAVNAPAAAPNNIRTAAGTLQDGVRSVRLVVRPAAWYPDGRNSCALGVNAFGEEGAAPSIPGPLLRVTVGGEIEISVLNESGKSLWIWGLHDRATVRLDSMHVAPGERQTVRFRATKPGMFFYWARPSGARRFTSDEDGQLAGVFIIDPADAPITDPIFVLTRWTRSGADDDSVQLNAINGGSWPNTERLAATVGDSVYYRVINVTNIPHPMHLHGFYFRILSLGTPTRDSVRPGVQALVTFDVNPAVSVRLGWLPERAGNWLFHCHITEHMLPAQRLERMPGARPAARPHGSHSHEMAGLILGISVRERQGAQRSAASAAPARRLRLFANTRPGHFGPLAANAFVLQEGNLSPAADSIRIPGTPLRLVRGEPVEITVMNRLRKTLSVHWHGIELESYFDGVAGLSGSPGRLAPAIQPGDSFVVRMTPPRAGTFIYHVHNEESQELSSGLYGALIVDEPGTPAGNEFTFVISNNPDQALVVNGATTPPPLELVAGAAYRLRFINIAPVRIVGVQLAGASGPAQWRVLARDAWPVGSPPTQAQFGTAVGQTADFEFTPQAPGELVLTLGQLEPARIYSGPVATARIRVLVRAP